MIEVKVYDSNTDELIGVYDSINIASYECEVSANAIKNSILGKTTSIKGMYFRSEDKINQPKNHYKIDMYDAKTGELLNTFDYLEQAANETGISKVNIWRNLKGIQKTVCKKQYIFKSDGLEYKPKHPEPYIQKGVSKECNKKAVDVYSCETNELLGTFDSVTKAAEFIGCKAGQVSMSLRNKPKRKQYGTIYKKYYCKYHYDK